MMTDEEAVKIAEKIMADTETDRLDGFGILTIAKLKALLMRAAKEGAKNGEGPF